MDESAGWCVSKRSPKDLRGWDPAGTLRAAVYETGVRNLPEPESVSSSAYQRTAHREAREGCALIVAHFQAAAPVLVCLCVRVYVHKTRAGKHTRTRTHTHNIHNYRNPMLQEDEEARPTIAPLHA